MITRRLILAQTACALLITGGSLGLGAPALAAPEDDAASHVRRLVAEGIAALRRPGLGVDERRAALVPILREGLDIPLMAKTVLGEAWGDASPATREDFTLLYGDYLIGTVTRRMESYSGESIAIKETSRSGASDFLVASNIVDAQGHATRAVWRVRDTAGAYRVIDVQIDGISLVATTRQEFASVIKNQGLEGLMRILQGKVQTARAHQ